MNGWRDQHPHLLQSNRWATVRSPMLVGEHPSHLFYFCQFHLIASPPQLHFFRVPVLFSFQFEISDDSFLMGHLFSLCTLMGICWIGRICIFMGIERNQVWDSAAATRVPSLSPPPPHPPNPIFFPFPHFPLPLCTVVKKDNFLLIPE